MRVDIDTSQLAEAGRMLTDAPRTLRVANARTIIKAGERGVATIRRKHRMAGETTSTSTASRSGHLADAYDYDHDFGEGQEQTLRVGVIKPGLDRSVLEYAKVHEHDGTTTIRPKRSKYLAIPLDEAKTARGVPRGTPRDFANLFPKRSRAGNLLLWQDRADTIVPMFFLADEVRIKGRPALLPVTEKQIIPEIEAGVTQNIEESFRGLG